MKEQTDSTAIGIIPARYNSTRYPGKPLIDLNGQTMLERVWRSANRAHFLKRVVVATDDERIAKECERISAEYLMTPSNLVSGTDRVAFTYEMLNDHSEIIVNIQGDEPLLESYVLDKLVREFTISKADVGTLVRQIDSHDDLDNHSIVKVVMRDNKTALYFSRSAIPCVRDVVREEWITKHAFWRHIGIYAYRRDALFRFVELKPPLLEKVEQLEQLRLLEDGAEFLCVETEGNFISVDTPEDAERVKAVLKR
ncbi:MAG: 3-deoxy-manno-octulosonate cytidylyltransferase [Bacteroidota bacterium]